MLNNVCIQGNLGADPEPRVGASGITSVSIRIAVRRNCKDSEGNYATDWFSVVAFGKTADFICTHFRRGDTIIVNGSLRSGSYTNSSGSKVYTVEIYASGVNFCGRAPSSGSSGSSVPEAAAVDYAPDYPF